MRTASVSSPSVTAVHPELQQLIRWLRGSGEDFRATFGGSEITILRPLREAEKARLGKPILQKVPQLIKSVNDTVKGELEQHSGRSFAGFAIRVAQRVRAPAVAIWHNHPTGAPVSRSLIANPLLD